MDDSFDKLKADMLADPEGRAAIRRVLDDEAEKFLRLAVHCARDIQLMEDEWQARRIMVEVTIWMTEMKKRMDKEIVAHQRATQTTEAFRR